MTGPPPDAAFTAALLDALFVRSPFSVGLYDAGGQVIAANGAYERHWGIRVADVPAGYSLFTDPQLAEAGLLPPLRRAFAGEHVVLPPVAYDAARATGRAGRTVWTQGHCHPVLGADGAVTHVAVVHVDVTALRESEEALHALNGTLADGNARLREQASALESHAAELTRARAEVEAERESLDRVVAQLPAAVAVLEGPELRFRAMSAAYRRIIGGREVLGMPFRDALPELSGGVDGVDFATLLEGVLATGVPVTGTDLPARWDADGDGVPEDRRVDLVYAPLRRRDGSGATVDGVTLLVSDVSDRARLLGAERDAHASAERAADRARRLQALTARLNQAATPAQVADAIFEGALVSVEAEAGSLAVVTSDDDGVPRRVHIVRSVGYDREVEERYRSFPVTPGRPLSAAIVSRRTVLIASGDEWRATFPGASEDLSALGYQAYAAVPVVANGRVVAALSFSYRAPQQFDEATRTFLATLAEQCALALERQRLHEAELRLAAEQAALLATIQDAFVALDERLGFTWTNAQAEALLGRPAAELMGRRLVDVFPHAQGTAIERAIGRVLETRERAAVEAFSPVAGRWIEARIYPAPGGVSLVLQDVTARRRAQEGAAFLAEASRLLADSLEYGTTLRTIAEAAVPRFADWCAVSLVKDPTAERWPPDVERVAAVHQDPAKLALGEALGDRYPTDWSVATGMAAVLRSGTPMFVPVVTDAMLVAGARDEVHLELLRSLGFTSLIIVPLLARGLTLGAVTLCMSESGRHYDEDDLALAQDLAQRAAVAVDNARLFRDAERARREAEDANRAKSQFLATMSHELRTPLNAIQGHVQLMELGLHGAVTDAQAGALGRVNRAQRHLLGLIEDVLSYARLESGRVEYDVRAVSVAEVVTDVVPMVEPQLADKGLTLEVRLPAPGDGPEHLVWADREKLGQVLLNLLSNAVKFTPSGGRVTIDLGSRAERAADVDQLFLRVSDTGIGIPRDKVDAVFEPFVQVRAAYAPASGGTGLGLSISRDLARGMGGDLRARSTQGSGSTFTVALRRAVPGSSPVRDRRTGEQPRVEPEPGPGDRREE